MFCPKLKTAEDHDLLVLHNPVAAARFFDHVVRLMIKHVLGVGEDHPGLYGETAAYYSTIEQQGCLTLHLHLILWIKGALSPQQIRDKIMNADSIFQQELINYLESCHIGEFMTGTIDQVSNQRPILDNKIGQGIHTIIDPTIIVTENKIDSTYIDPTQTLPQKTSLGCKDNNHLIYIETCDACTKSSNE